MEHEELWEVDANDEPVGPRARGEIHRLGLRHRATHILVYNPAGEVYLQKRSASKDVSPGCWDTSAAGHVDFGESYDDCAARELEEELGIAAPGGGLEFLFKLEASAATGWEFVQVYRLVHAGSIRPDPAEIEEGRWFPAETLDAWIADGGEGLTRSFRLIWEAARAAPFGSLPR